jgi:hypothetical protein
MVLINSAAGDLRDGRRSAQSAKEAGCEVVQYPPVCADLNVTEDVLDYVKKQIQKLTFSDVDCMRTGIFDQWAKVSICHINKLIRSLPSKVVEVVQQGNSTRGMVWRAKVSFSLAKLCDDRLAVRFMSAIHQSMYNKYIPCIMLATYILCVSPSKPIIGCLHTFCLTLRRYVLANDSCEKEPHSA